VPCHSIAEYRRCLTDWMMVVVGAAQWPPSVTTTQQASVSILSTREFSFLHFSSFSVIEEHISKTHSVHETEKKDKFAVCRAKTHSVPNVDWVSFGNVLFSYFLVNNCLSFCGRCAVLLCRLFDIHSACEYVTKCNSVTTYFKK